MSIAENKLNLFVLNYLLLSHIHRVCVFAFGNKKDFGKISIIRKVLCYEAISETLSLCLQIRRKTLEANSF